MDIRQASRGLHGTEARGTIPPAAIAEEKTPRPVPEVDGDATLKSPLEEFGPESVIKSYRDFLHARDISDDDIRDVLEYLITSGNVSWKFELFDRIPAEFRIRPSWVDDYILETIDRETAGDERLSMMRYNNLVAVCNLAASLVSFKDETYRVEDFDKARKRVQDMPYIIQNALVNKLAVFDRTIAVATSDWAIKNFMRPRKEK